MASCVRNIRTKNYQNLIIGFQVTVKNVGDVFETQCTIRLLLGDVGQKVQCDPKQVVHLFLSGSRMYCASISRHDNRDKNVLISLLWLTACSAWNMRAKNRWETRFCLRAWLEWHGRSDLTKAAVTISCVGKFDWNLALWLPDFAVLLRNFGKIRCCWLELRKCTQGFTHVTLYQQRRYFVINVQQLITPLKKQYFQRHLAIALAIYCGSSVKIFVRPVHIWHFYFTLFRGLFLFWTQCRRTKYVKK